MKAFWYALLSLYAAEVNLNESGKSVMCQLWLKSEKKNCHAVVIFDVSNDHAGKLSSAQLVLKPAKKYLHAVVNHVENLNDHAGKLVNAQLALKLVKKSPCTVVMFDVSNDPVDRLVNAQ